jgi:very-short-patch-repair endonuclease
VQERAVLEFLLAAVADGRLGQAFKYNARFGKLTLRPDFTFDRLVVEVDEKQHKQYCETKEMDRMRAITEEANQPMVFIRFNPDTYKINGVVQNVPIEERHQMLLEHIQYYLSFSLEETNRLQAARLTKMGEPVNAQNLRQSIITNCMYYDNAPMQRVKIMN